MTSNFVLFAAVSDDSLPCFLLFCCHGNPSFTQSFALMREHVAPESIKNSIVLLFLFLCPTLIGRKGRLSHVFFLSGDLFELILAENYSFVQSS